MTDHVSEMLELQNRRDDEKYARDNLLRGTFLHLDDDIISWILNHIDCFVSQSRGNKMVMHVSLYAFDGHGDGDVWGKVGSTGPRDAQYL
jgi:hypothetical protein